MDTVWFMWGMLVEGRRLDMRSSGRRNFSLVCVVILGLVLSCQLLILPAEAGESRDVSASEASESSLSGQAVFADGLPAANMRIRFEGTAAENGQRVRSEETTTDHQGRFAVGFAGVGIADGVALLAEVVDHDRLAFLGHTGLAGGRWSTPVKGLGPESPIRLVFENRGAISATIAPAKEYPGGFFAFRAALTRAAGPHGDGLLTHPPEKPGKAHGDGGTIVFRGLEPGAYTVEVRALAGPGWRWSKQVTISENAPARAQVVRFDLPEPSYGRIHARVVSEKDGTPIPRTSGFLTGIRFHRGLEVRDGVVEVSDVPPGEYRIRVSGVIWPPSGEAIVVEGGETIDLGDIPVRQWRRPFDDRIDVIPAEGRILYEDGTPATGATVLLSSPHGQPVNEDGGFTTRVRKGTSIVGVDLTYAKGWQGEDAPPGPPSMPLPNAPRCVALIPVHLEDDSPSELQLTLDRRNRVPIRIEGFSRQAKELTVRIVVDSDAWQYYTEGSLLGGDDGLTTAHWTAGDACAIEGIPPGDAVLVILSDAYRGCVKLAADGPERVVRIDSRETGSITGRVTAGTGNSQDMLPGATVYVKASELTGGPGFNVHGESHGFSGRFHVVATGVTGMDGTFRIESLAQGTYWAGLGPSASSADRLVNVCANDYPWADWEGWVGIKGPRDSSTLPPRPDSTEPVVPPPPKAKLTAHAFWNTMSDDERKEYLSRAIKLETHPRLEYPQGNEAYIRVEYGFTLPWGWPPPEPRAVFRHYVDGEPYGKPFKYDGYKCAEWEVVPGLLDLGTHTYYWTLGYRLKNGDKSVSSVLTSDTFTFEVVSADTPDRLAAPSDPRLDQHVRAAFEIAGTLPGVTPLSACGLRQTPQWKLSEPLPIDLCFEVEMHALNTGDVHAGYPIVVLKGTTGSGSFLVRGGSGAPWPVRDGTVALRVVLRPSGSTALYWPGVTCYYCGTIESEVIEAPVRIRPKPVS
jgi:hypothetical protein